MDLKQKFSEIKVNSISIQIRNKEAISRSDEEIKVEMKALSSETIKSEIGKDRKKKEIIDEDEEARREKNSDCFFSFCWFFKLGRSGNNILAQIVLIMYIPSLQSYKNINKIIKVKMADHTQINFSKFATLTMTDRYNKFSSTKRKSKKSHSTLVNP